jgi:uncharacterized protein YcfJ
MEKKYGAYVFPGLLIGAIFGTGLGAANGNAILGSAGGALVGVFIGWFIAAAAIEKEKMEKKNDQ